MNTFSISYDLVSPGRDYSALYAEIKKLGAWWHHLESTWLVQSSFTAAQSRDRLKLVLDSNDKLLVAEIGDWASFGLPVTANEWLRTVA